MRDLTPDQAGALCFDPTLYQAPRLHLRRAAEQEGQVIAVDGLLVVPRWIHPTYDALAECAEHGHDVACLRGARIAALIRSHQRPERTGPRRQQFRRHDDSQACLDLARSLILAKTAGQVAVLRQAARRREDTDLGERADRCSHHRHGLAKAPTLDHLRGREGIIARSYFGGWPRLLDLPSFQRIPRRALNPINHLLDLCYSRLCLQVTLALLDADLDVALGALHAPDGHRPTLALDLMEPLRPLIADRFVLANYRRALDQQWFLQDGSRWTLTSAGRRGLRERWIGWMHGSAHRPGQISAVQATIATYQAWLQFQDTLPWPSWAG